MQAKCKFFYICSHKRLDTYFQNLIQKVMKNLSNSVLAALVGLAAVLTSCSVKEELLINPVSSKSKVCIDVQTFNLEQSAIATKANSASLPHRLVFKALDSGGKTAWESVQASSDPEFGTVNFELAPGDYTFVAVAHDLSVTSHDDVAATIVSASQVVFPEPDVHDSFCASKQGSLQRGRYGYR